MGSTFVHLNIGLFILSLMILVSSLILNSEAYKERNWILKHVSSPSPILNEIDLKILNKHMEATLMLPENLSIYRQDPSLEVDIAWQRLGDLRLIPLTQDEVRAIGKEPNDAVKFPESFGLGPNAYAGRVDVFHQIHCLDSLRREAYFQHYYGMRYPGGFNDTTEMHRLHLSHCIHYLLQHIMCQASTDVYTHIWTDGVDHPFPDFDTTHQCRDYDAIKKWQNRNAIDVGEFVALRAPPGAKVHRMSKKFKELHGYFDTHVDDGIHGEEIA